MSRPHARIQFKELVRYLFPLILAIFLFAQARLGNASISQYTSDPYKPTSPYDQGAVTCGKLVFLEDRKTGAKLIGLRACSGGEVFIFGQRPAELFNYYEFYGAVVKNGEPITDPKYGTLKKYIVSFNTYRMIPDCSYCGKAYSPPTNTFPPPPPPTETPVPIAPVETEVVSATEVVERSPVLVDVEVNNECINQTAQVVAQAMGFPKFQFLIDQAPNILKQAPGAEVCGDDPVCLKMVKLKTLMAGMVGASFDASPGPRPIGQVMGAIASLMDRSEISTACQMQGVMAVEMAKQFSIKGMAIDAYSVHSPVRFRVRDFENKDSGFFKSGEVKQDIPLSVTRSKDDGEYVFLPSSSVAAVEFEGIADGVMTFEAVRNAGSVVQEIGYDQVPVEPATRGNLDVAAAARPQLRITASSSGQLASIDPTRYEEFAIVASVAPVTATPTATETATLTPTPAGFQLNADSRLWVGLLLIVCVGALLALLLVGLIYYFFLRRKTK